MENFLHLAETEVNAAIVLLNLLFVLTLELIIMWVYRKTHHGLSYSQSFVLTILMMGLISSLIMMVITENIVGAFALLGAFSLIRFRTIVKETRDIAFVFFSLAIGVAGGTNNYTVALVGTIIISIVLLVLNRFNFGSSARGGHLLIVTVRGSFEPTTNSNWKEYISWYEPLHIRTLSDQLREYTFGLQLKSFEFANQLIDTLKKDTNIDSIELISGKDSVEY